MCKRFTKYGFILILFAFSFVLKANENHSVFRHMIQDNETLFSIARYYKVSQVDILELNPLIADVLIPGEYVLVPYAKDANKVFRQGILPHFVTKNETIESIADLYEISTSSIYLLNPSITEPLAVGDKILVIPSVYEKMIDNISRKTQLYCLKKTDTFYNLSEKSGLSIAALLKLNPILKNGIKEGNFILLPVQTDNNYTK